MTRLHLLMDNPIGEMRLDNRAKLNALTPDMLTQMAAHCDAIAASANLIFRGCSMALKLWSPQAAIKQSDL